MFDLLGLFASRRWDECREKMKQERERQAYVDSVYSIDNINEFIIEYNNLDCMERDPYRASVLFPNYVFIFFEDSNMIERVIDMT